MANEEKKEVVYKITNEKNPYFCGVDAGGVQFANGEATCKSERMVSWFKEHPGYKVEKI